ncbi:hypothetical protein ACR3K2_38160 [Cryptosporidium serpentis]
MNNDKSNKPLQTSKKFSYRLSVMYFPYLFIYLYIFTLIPKLQTTNISKKFRSCNERQHTVLIEESNKSKILHRDINNKKHFRTTKLENFVANSVLQPSISRTNNPKMLRGIPHLDMGAVKIKFRTTTNILPEISTYKKNTTESCKNGGCHYLYQILDNGVIQSIQALPHLTLLNTTNERLIKRALWSNNISRRIHGKKYIVNTRLRKFSTSVVNQQTK